MPQTRLTEQTGHSKDTCPDNIFRSETTYELRQYQYVGTLMVWQYELTTNHYVESLVVLQYEI
jgi:hypothetical protein